MPLSFSCDTGGALGLYAVLFLSVCVCPAVKKQNRAEQREMRADVLL
jgi:hypothetical protein